MTPMTPEKLNSAVFGLFATHVLHLADKHDVFAHLPDAGSAPAEKIAVAAGVDAETLERMLLVLCALDIVLREDGGYRLHAGYRPYLDRTSPLYLGSFLEHLVTSTSTKIDRLDDYLRLGKVEADRGNPAPFAAIYATEDSTRRFLAAMWNLSFDVSHELVSLAGFHGTEHIVDVGGASGAFAVAALQAHPGLTVTVFDLPEVEPFLAETARTHGLGDRLRFAAGNFFTDPLPAADCYSFGYILSDWTDETCASLLRNAYDSGSAGARVLIAERLFDEDRTGPLPTAVMNLSMHVETEGRHRTPEEYVRLLAGAGFPQGRVHRTTQDKHLVIGARPATD
ncbi:methyltransferase [Micromonospora sp. DT201]|uniref:methyltransferase n=1 Tax=Micromonospora sp. DT201 TaxID=3393442 RepID=UPI003CEE16C8